MDNDDVTVLELAPGSIILVLEIVAKDESRIVSEVMALQALQTEQPIFTLSGVRGEKIEFKLKEKIRVQYVDKVRSLPWKFPLL